MKELQLDFCGTYREQGFLHGELLDFRPLDGTQCYCSATSADAIRSALAPFGPGGIHWIDSGDYHYASLFFLEMIHRPFCLVLFDHHSDDGEDAFGSGMLSCGNWVAFARRLPLWREDDGALPVYISIDKDVLSREYARTDWDQGDMTLGQLCSCITQINSCRQIIGIDVCGEISLSKGACGEDLEINRSTNEKLRELFLNLNR